MQPTLNGDGKEVAKLHHLEGVVATKIIWNSPVCKMYAFYPHLLCHSSIYLYHFQFNIYLILGLLVQYSIVYFSPQIVPALAIGSASFISDHFFAFWHYKRLQRYLMYIFLLTLKPKNPKPMVPYTGK